MYRRFNRILLFCSFYLIILGFYYYTSFLVSKFHVHVDDSFNKEERGVILDSLKEWSESTEGIAKFEDIKYEAVDKLNKYDPKGLSFLRRDLFIVKVKHHEDSCPILHHRLEDIEIGETVVYYSGNAVECLESDYALKRQYFRRVVLHETGHALGLRFPGKDSGHNTNESEDSVLHPSVLDDSNYVTCSDLYYFCKQYDCKFGCE